MNINKSILCKRTKKLFFDKYQYKIVLVCNHSGLFRTKNYSQIMKKLKERSDSFYEQEVLKFIDSVSNFILRVESPFISFYTNDISDVKKLTDINPSKVKYISLPENLSEELEPKTLYLKNINYDYKITLKNYVETHNNFLGWAENNPKVRMSESCRKALETDGYSNNSYFYAKDYKTLTMIQIFIGPYISRIDKIVNLSQK